MIARDNSCACCCAPAPSDVDIIPDYGSVGAAVPNDPRWNDSSIAMEQISAPQAWDISTGSQA